MHVLLALVIVALSALHPMHSRPRLLADAVIWHFDPPEPGLDEADGWFRVLINSGVEISGAYGYVTSPNALNLDANYTPPYWGDAAAGKVATVSVGETYSFSAMVNADLSSSGVQLRVQVYDRDPSGYYGPLLGEWSVTKAALGSGWQPWIPGSFTAGQVQVIIEVYARDPSRRSNGRWVLDEVTLTDGGDPMAVLLGELPLRATLALYQANLAPELAAIQTERADSITIDAPTKYRCWKADAPSPDVTECEVYLDPAGSSFPTFAQDANRFNVGGRTYMRSSVRVVVAVNHANRVGYRTSEMVIRSLRVGAAMARVLRNSPQLGFAGMSVMCKPDPVRYSVQIVGGDNPREIQRTEFSFIADISENPDLENTAGGGVPPACILET